VEIAVARTFRERLLGLALRQPGPALLIPGCRSVHTFGMRFPLDLVWLDRDGRVLGLDLGVPHNRVRTRRDAVAVLEVPSARALK
jgi:uncharacterized protein